MYRVAILSLSLAACAATPSGEPHSNFGSERVYRYVVPVAAADSGFVDVTGTGVVMVEPDRARISFAVETEGETAREAVRENADRMRATIDALEGAEADLEIRTNGYSVQPRYRRANREGGEMMISGYTTVNHIEVTTHRVADVGLIIDRAAGAGVNRVASLVFMSSEVEAARTEALRLAILDARHQAETMASALGIPLGPPLEVRANNPRRQQDSNLRALAMEVSTPIAAGDQAVRANVTIRFRLGAR
jgi:uncharacterized protein